MHRSLMEAFGWATRLERRPATDLTPPTPMIAYALSAIAVVVVSALLLPLRELFGGANLSLVYVMLLFGIGLAFGAGPAIASAMLAFLISDYLYYPPYRTLLLDKSAHLLGLLIFLGIAIATGMLGASLRRRAGEIRREVRRTSMLYDLNRALISDVTLDQVLTTIVRGVVDIYGARGSRLLVPDVKDPDAFTVAATWPAGHEVMLNRQSLHMARHVLETGSVAGLGVQGRRIMVPHGVANRPRDSLHRAGDDLLFVPVGASDALLGVLEVAGRPGGGRFGYDDERMLKSFADQAALAVQRARLIEEATRSRVLEQSSELKSALLAAVSHDLRTPLAAIKMSASALRSEGIAWEAADRTELLSAIEESADWLALVVDNLLDLSRIEGAALRPDRDWCDLADLLHHATAQADQLTGDHPVTVDIAEDLPLVFVDYVEIAQVMANLLSNAAKYSPPGSVIEVTATEVDGDAVEIAVRDHGAGVPAGSLPHIFEPFYRVHPDGEIAGSGVGLSIAKGLVEAHGGTMRAESTIGEGTIIRLRLPTGTGA